MFQFKQFAIADDKCGMKLGTDSVLLGAWASIAPGAKLIADLGAGCGILALMAAQRAPQAAIAAIEIDPDACAQARANAMASPWHSRIAAHCANALDIDREPLSRMAGDTDLILCNPPYFEQTLISPRAQRAVARHSIAMEGSRRLSPATALEAAAKLLAPGGDIAMVTPADGEQDLLFRAELLRLRLRRLCRVSTVEGRAPTRLLWQLSRTDGPIERTAMAIRLPDGSPSPAYKALAADFYLRF